MINITLNDLLKRVPVEDRDKVVVFTDGIGWTNVDFVEPGEHETSTIKLRASYDLLFKDE